MADLGGICDPRFEPVRDALAASIGAGVEVGASLYVAVDDEPVVDLWGGWRDPERTVPWTEDTIVNVWSTTKMVTSLAVLVLVDRGEIDVRAPVARYWPEFGQNGKERVQVRHLLSHTSGVSGWDQPFRIEDLYDLRESTARLARQAPWWEPGTASAYHASNFGHLCGELVRRVTGKTLGRFVAEEVAGPLDADFHIGLGDADFTRVAALCPPSATRPLSAPFSSNPAAEAVRSRTLAGSIGGQCPDPTALGNTPEWRRAEIGASNGHGNARGIGRIVSALTHGGISRGVRLLSPETVELIFQEQASGTDLYLNAPVRWGVGYALAAEREAAGRPYGVPAARKDMLLGRMGRINGDHGRRAPGHDLLRAEPDAHPGRRIHPGPVLQRRLRGTGQRRADAGRQRLKFGRTALRAPAARPAWDAAIRAGSRRAARRSCRHRARRRGGEAWLGPARRRRAGPTRARRNAGTARPSPRSGGGSEGGLGR